MDILRNFFVAFFIVTIVSRVIAYFTFKKTGLTNAGATYLTLVLSVVILSPLAFFIGLDVFVSEYLVTICIWLVIDLLRVRTRK
ncbi:MAG: hypothetical protein COT84_03280 [Chlamydiae bacterium CG10_big_fil_rev_8_21_14_0_10_35_9]|nr:MAG: hypothetical protein COT84_03280 [Chlamydiae bacterium CG10_big_fil_rev_8_21_14_0_10_35_9]